MKRKWMLVLSPLLVMIIAAGCSSLPKKVESQSLKRARVKMKMARSAQRLQEYKKALRLYNNAYDLYTRIDDIGGKIDAGLAIARQCFYLEKKDQTQVWLDKASNLIDGHLPGRRAARAVLLMEMAFARNDHQKIVEIAAKTSLPQNDPEVQAEILSYAMVAKARLKESHEAELNLLLKLLPSLQRRFGKNRLDDPEVLSLAYYNTGYIYSSVLEDWRTALDYFAKARSVDGLIDNAYGVAKDLYAMGRCNKELGSFNEAASCFERAAEIFRLLNDPDMAKRAVSQLDSTGKKR